ncbi:DUF6268 family outer membrane beta-barrel protein [Pyxidicoccus trucidator]|uniref:DUF6268 family outer membrane beta-barrel protein n=1 Tax=Pyxidicoccus trucidator TaxID=2709662 RepID=UPI0013DA3CC4|nr:DUF6268 family outer membrane beta-barrel protein [Pyxidicoccus trucidator]
MRWAPGSPWLLALAVVLLACGASAQTSVDRAFVSVTAAPGTSLGERVGWLTQRRQLDVFLSLPPLFLDGTRLILAPTVTYGRRVLSLEDSGLRDEDASGYRMHHVQLGLSLIRPLPPRWLFILSLSASARSDFREGFQPGEDLAWTGVFLASRNLDAERTVKLSFGLVVVYPFDLLPVIPLVGLVYRRGDYIAEVGFPRVNLLRKLGEGLEVGVTGSFERQTFHASLPQAREALGAHYVQETSLRVAHALNVRLWGELWLNTAAGLIVANGFTLLDRRRERIGGMDLGASTTPYARVDLSWRPAPRVPATVRPAPAGAREGVSSRLGALPVR